MKGFICKELKKQSKLFDFIPGITKISDAMRKRNMH